MNNCNTNGPMPNKLSQFWQELKRRKVVRVITVYAAAAFVILELVDIIVEPLKLPEWTLPLFILFALALSLQLSSHGFTTYTLKEV